MQPATPFDGLMRWYAQHCNDDWEHQFGISIESLDNPGWMLEVNLADTSLSQAALMEDGIIGDGPHWMQISVADDPAKGRVFRGACGPLQLAELVDAFLSWAARQRSDHV